MGIVSAEELDRFAAAFGAGDVEAIMALMTEDSWACGDNAVLRWRFSWDGGHVRGVDVLRFRDGKVCEKLSYVKG